MILSAAMLCMALNVYHESRSEPLAGQVAVALVTMNRVKNSGLDVCSVVYQYKQFSWTNGRFLTEKTRIGKKTVVNRTNKLDPDWVKEYLHPKDRTAWKIAIAVAESTMGGYNRNFLGEKVRFYHADYVNPIWNKEKHYIGTIGTHLFYRNKINGDPDVQKHPKYVSDNVQRRTLSLGNGKKLLSSKGSLVRQAPKRAGREVAATHAALQPRKGATQQTGHISVGKGNQIRARLVHR